jgi:hypothetical protein
MKLIASLLLLITLNGCAELVSYAIGTLGNVTGDLIMNKIDDKKEKVNKDAPKKRNE